MMNMDLAAMYGTPGGPSQEDLEKTAQADLFVKLATESGIDLSQYSDDQIEHLWNATFAKTASDDEGKGDEDEDEDEEKKEKEAMAEFASQQEWQEKVAEMDYLGRLMAHAYVQELGEIEKQAVKGAIYKARRGLGAAREYMRGLPGRARGAVEERVRRVGAKQLPKETTVVPGRRIVQPGTGKVIAEKGAITRGQLPEEQLRAGYRTIGRRAAIGGGAAAGVGAAGAAGYAATRKKKAASAIDEYAFDLAVEKVAELGWDPNEAAERMDALFTLDAVPETAKLASAGDVNEAIDIRSLELLEAAGYPVTWY